MELANKFLQSVVVQIRDSRNTVAFKTPRVLKKTPLLIVEKALLYQLSHQLNHLAGCSALALRLLSRSAGSLNTDENQSIFPPRRRRREGGGMGITWNGAPQDIPLK
jgi:hypothetical protein